MIFFKKLMFNKNLARACHNGIIRRATKTDFEQISSLRFQAYQTAKEFTITNPSQLHFDAYDQNDEVLVACDRTGQIIATMRGGIIYNNRQAVERSECELSLVDDYFPALFLSRAATHPAYCNNGIHTAIRYYFLSAACISPIQIQSLLGHTYINAPRTKLMKTMGYEFHKPPNNWTTTIKSRLQQDIIALLPRAKFQSAQTFLEENFKLVIEAYPWQGETLEFLPRFNLLTQPFYRR